MYLKELNYLSVLNIFKIVLWMFFGMSHKAVFYQGAGSRFRSLSKNKANIFHFRNFTKKGSWCHFQSTWQSHYSAFNIFLSITSVGSIRILVALCRNRCLPFIRRPNSCLDVWPELISEVSLYWLLSFKLSGFSQTKYRLTVYFYTIDQIYHHL